MPVVSYTLASAVNTDGRLQIFAAGSFSGHIYTCSQIAPNGGWNAWKDLGGPGDIAQLAVGRNVDGRLELFASRKNGAIALLVQNAPNGEWSHWIDDIGAVHWRYLILGTNLDGRLELFGLVDQGNVYHIWQTAPNSGWSASESFGTQVFKQLAVASNADGRFELLAIGEDESCYSISQVAPNDGWGQWSNLRTFGWKEISLIPNLDKRLEIIALVGDARNAYRAWQTAPNGGWSGSVPLGGHDLRWLKSARNADGRLEVFVIGGNNSGYHTWQLAANNEDNWAEWTDFGGIDWRAIEVAPNADGRLELFVMAGAENDAKLYHAWQLVPNGNWSGSTEFPDPEPHVTVKIDGNPKTIKKGQSTTLSWTSTGATSASIDQGIGPVPPTGSRSVTPPETGVIVYTITARGPGGTSTDTQRIIVEAGGQGGDVTMRVYLGLQGVGSSLFFAGSISPVFGGVLKSVKNANSALGAVSAMGLVKFGHTSESCANLSNSNNVILLTAGASTGDMKALFETTDMRNGVNIMACAPGFPIPETMAVDVTFHDPAA
jgi:hypothetical protein